MNELFRVAGRAMVGLLLAVALAGCATTGGDPEAHDPYEKTNRAIFKFNMALDRNVMKPIAKAYVWALPGRVRVGVHNFLDNLNTPVYLANDLLQGDWRAAIPVALATAATLVSPKLHRVFSNGAVRNYALTPGGWQQLLDQRETPNRSG